MPLGSYRLSQYLSMPLFQPISATGGQEIIDKSDENRLYRYHVFTGSSNFVVDQPGSYGQIEYWIVAGGGAGGGNQDTGGAGAGGGAGGLLTNLDLAAVTVTGQSYTITIGAGGTDGGLGATGNNGNSSSAFNVTADGGGGGARGGGGNGTNNGLNGASGGGGSVNNTVLGTAGTGISGQGFAGGLGIGDSSNRLLRAAGGGGGAGEVGANATHNGTQGQGGAGGDGRFFKELETIVGTTGDTSLRNIVPGWIAGGGGGGINTTDGDITTVGSGGKGGGARGGAGLNPNQGIVAQANSGGGGGGGGRTSLRRTGGAGGSGIVIVRYPLEKKQVKVSASTGSDFATTWQIQVPTGAQVGDLLLSFGGARDDRSVTPPSGWTEIADQKNGTISAAHIFWRRATSADVNGATYNYTPESGGGYTNVCLVVKGGKVPTISTATVASTNTPATNSVSGTSDSIYISFIGARNLGTTTISSIPTGHKQLAFATNPGSFVALSSLESLDSSHNPSSWTFTSGETSQVVGWTLRC